MQAPGELGASFPKSFPGKLRSPPRNQQAKKTIRKKPRQVTTLAGEKKKQLIGRKPGENEGIRIFLVFSPGGGTDTVGYHHSPFTIINHGTKGVGIKAEK